MRWSCTSGALDMNLERSRVGFLRFDLAYARCYNRLDTGLAQVNSTVGELQAAMGGCGGFPLTRYPRLAG